VRIKEKISRQQKGEIFKKRKSVMLQTFTRAKKSSLNVNIDEMEEESLE